MCSEQQLPLSEHANVSCCCCFWTFSKREANHLEKAGRTKQRGRFSPCFTVEVIWVKSRPPCQSVTHLCWWALTHQALSNNCWLDVTSESRIVKGWTERYPVFLLVIQWKGSDLVDWTLSFLYPMREKKKRLSEDRLEANVYVQWMI